ncbi:PEP-CTERM sorting domain-containing protein [Rugamonas sp. A1-17]|nr:PEP-CTERM sorting domain-containing protein [Rugamonas sp. A1-17]
MSIKSLAAASILALSFCASGAQAWTLVATGHITSGTDTTGVFGVAGEDLTGLSYTQSMTISTAVHEWTGSMVDEGRFWLLGAGPSVTDTIVLKGKTFTFTAPSVPWGTQQLELSSGPYGSNNVWSQTKGLMADGSTLFMGYSVFSNTAQFLKGLTFQQTISVDTTGPLFPADSNRSYVHFNSEYVPGLPTAYFDGSLDHFSIYPTPDAPIPEPATYGMLLAGLGLIGAFARRRA